MKPLIIVVEILLLAAECVSAERGKPFVPPVTVPEPELRLVVESAPVGSPAACPQDASVLIQVIDGASVFCGSGTCVSSENGESLILTCAHTWRGTKSPDIRVIHQKRDLVATIVKQDAYTDLAVLRVKAEIPSIDLADALPSVGDTVVSWGASHNGQNLQELTHAISRIGLSDKPPTIKTDNRSLQWSGRSGGGLFHNGKLVGVVHGLGKHEHEPMQSAYATLDQVREMLSSPVGSSQKFAVTLWKAPFRCVPCDRSEVNLKNDPRFDLTVKTGPAPFMDDGWRHRNRERGYPYFEIGDKIYHGYTTADGLANLLESEQPTVSGPVGASIQGRAAIEATLEKLSSLFGDDAEFSFRWVRNDALDALPMGKAPTREELLGKSGRIEIRTTSNKLPVHSIAFDYRFVGSKVYFRLDEIECEIPEDGSVSGPQPVGAIGILTAWTILSTIQTIHALMTPTISVWLGKEINASAKLSDGNLIVDCGPNPPSVKANWRLWWGLLRWEYSRPLTGLIVGVPETVIQFHQSRIYKDIVLEVNE